MNINRAIFLSFFVITAFGQTISREYIRFNGRIVAIEGGGLDPIPTLVSLSPVNGSGNSATFTGVFSDTAGASHITEAQFWFSSTSTNCHLAYFPGANLIYLDSSAKQQHLGWGKRRALFCRSPY